MLPLEHRCLIDLSAPEVANLTLDIILDGLSLGTWQTLLAHLPGSIGVCGLWIEGLGTVKSSICDSEFIRPEYKAFVA